MQIGKEGEAFVAEPLPEPVEVPEVHEPEREKVLVPVRAVRREREAEREEEAVPA